MLKVDLTEFNRRMERYTANLDKINWMGIGETVEESIKLNFDCGGRPERWTPRKVEPRPYHPVLDKTHRLKNGFYIMEVRDGVTIGNKVPWQATHNFGDPERNIAQREYMLLQDDDKRKIAKDIIEDILK
jgi:phage gpG-like protein